LKDDESFIKTSSLYILRGDLSMTSAINIVLVHGAFCDGSSWSKIIPPLQQAGHNVLAVQLPLNSLSGDMVTVRNALASLAGPTILVGHSYGGAVITGAATDAANVIGLVYVAAYVPDEGENLQVLNDKFAGTEGQKSIGLSYLANAVWIAPAEFPRVFAADLDLAEARMLASVQKPMGFGCLSETSGPPAWKNIPSWYLVSANDLTLNPDAQRWMAQRIHASTITLSSSHASPVSHPQEVANTLLHAIHVTEGVS
jgi:pimeloyl-ACP methyl ester carboxylesterase